jgi:hypothetical protein
VFICVYPWHHFLFSSANQQAVGSYQGTASAVPMDRKKGVGFSPCARTKAPSKAFGYRCVAARLKPVP